MLTSALRQLALPLLCLVLLGPSLWAQEPPRRATLIHCTPTQITVEGTVMATANPIPDALVRAAPGCLITLSPGDYPAFRIGFNKGDNNAKNTGGLPGLPIIVRGEGAVRVRSGDGGDTVSICQDNPNGHITFENIEFEPSYRAAILFYRPAPGGVNEGYHFYDCNIIGGWDHRKAAGKTSKWGLNGKRLKDFEWIGKTRPSIIQDIEQEHAFYLSNMAGNTTIRNVEAKRLGRTFVQLVSRSKDGPAGVGRLLVQDCKISDTNIAAGDNFKGGSAFTVSGNMPKAELRFENNTYRGGFDKSLHKLTAKGQPYGAGAFVAWSEKEADRLGNLILIDNDFRFAHSCGDRPVVSITACRSVKIIGSNHFEAGTRDDGIMMRKPGFALALDNPPGTGTPAPLPNLKVLFDPSTTIIGNFEIKGVPATDADRKSLGLTK